MRFRSFSFLSGTLACALGLAIALAGCRSLPPSKPQSEWTAEETRGAQIYSQAITKVQAMPSGQPPTDERLTAVILHGRNMMPATSLTDAQLSDLLAYLHSL